MALRRSDAALAVLALASIAAFTWRPRAQPAGQQAPAAGRHGGNHLLQLRPEAAVVAPPPTDLRACEARLASARRDVAAIQRKVERNRNVFELYDRAQPAPGLAAELGALFSTTMEGDGGPPPAIDMHCRGRICCARAAGDAGIEDAMEPFADRLHDRRRLRGGLSWRNQREACFGVVATGDPPEAIDIVGDAVKALRRSGAIERCQQRFPGQGALDTRINIVGDPGEIEDAPPGISVRAGGKLAGTPLGDCIAAELKRALDAVELPADHESGVLYAQFPKQ
jgi:hypothetical protein